MRAIIHTSKPLTVDEVAELRHSVRAQLDDGQEVVVLPMGCTIEFCEEQGKAVALHRIGVREPVRLKGERRSPAVVPPPEPPPTRFMHWYGVETEASKAATLDWRIGNTVAPPMPPRR